MGLGDDRIPSGNRSREVAARDAVERERKIVRPKHNDWPDNLEQLTVKDTLGMKYLESLDAIKDPWGKPYIYEKSGAKNAGEQPDIYTTAPDGEMIGNWPKALTGR